MDRIIWTTTNVDYVLQGAASLKWHGKPRPQIFRIDMREATIRVDRHTLFGWEAIDEGAWRFRDGDLDKAKAWAERWLVSAEDQQSLTPSVK